MKNEGRRADDMKTKTVDEIVNALRPGQSVELSRVGEVFVTVERTGNGQRVRFVRHSGNKTTVFHSSAF